MRIGHLSLLNLSRFLEDCLWAGSVLWGPASVLECGRQEEFPE